MNRSRIVSVSRLAVWMLMGMIAAGAFCALSQAAEDNGKSEMAFEQVRKLGRGVNVLGWDPIWRNRERGRFQAEHFKLIRDAGFNHVRLVLHPMRDSRAGADNKISDAWFETVDWAIDSALANGLMVILDVHEYNTMAKDPGGKKDRFLAMWRQIAEHTKGRPNEVLFELLNEPHGELTPELWNQFLKEALATVRESNPNRTVIIGPANWNGIGSLEQLQLPQDDRNIIVTVHYYSPMDFTHQGASWSSSKDKVGVKWSDTPEERKAIESDFDKAQAWARKNNRPIYLGEFGAYDKADMDSRVRWTSTVAREAEERDWAWGYWQFDGDFIVYNIGEKRWVEPIRDALIPPKK